MAASAADEQLARMRKIFCTEANVDEAVLAFVTKPKVEGGLGCMSPADFAGYFTMTT